VKGEASAPNPRLPARRTSANISPSGVIDVVQQPSTLMRRRQLSFEIRYSNAYRLWDNAGQIATELGDVYSNLNSDSANPNLTSFTAESRYSISVGLDKSFVIDHKAAPLNEEYLNRFDGFYNIIVNNLRLGPISRVGCRIVWHIVFPDRQAARQYVSQLNIVAAPKDRLFDISPQNQSPTFAVEIDDGEVGFRAQIQAQTRKFDLSMGPEFHELYEGSRTKLEESVVFDVDFFTVSPVMADSLRPSLWITRWDRIFRRDIDSITTNRMS
jgi:hypothetical protein